MQSALTTQEGVLLCAKSEVSADVIGAGTVRENKATAIRCTATSAKNCSLGPKHRLTLGRLLLPKVVDGDDPVLSSLVIDASSDVD